MDDASLLPPTGPQRCCHLGASLEFCAVATWAAEALQADSFKEDPSKTSVYSSVGRSQLQSGQKTAEHQ